MTDEETTQAPAPAHDEADDMRQYLRQIRVIPRLTPEQERELAKRCAQGDEDAIRQMVSANLRLVVSIAREYTGRGVPLMDLVQEGSLGLLVAARKFDYSLDYRFSTYATKWIRQGVTRCILNHGSTIRVPLHTAEYMKRIEAARRSLQTELHAEPTSEQLAQRVGLSAEKVEQLQRLVPEVYSLDSPAGESETSTLGTLLEDTLAPQPQEELVRQELEHTIGQLLGQLTPRQRQIVRLRYGMEDGTCWTFESIGQKLGVSKERARQLDRQAMKRLQELGAEIGLEDFLS